MGLTCFWGGGEVDQAGHGLCSVGWMLKFSLRREPSSKDTVEGRVSLYGCRGRLVQADGAARTKAVRWRTWNVLEQPGGQRGQCRMKWGSRQEQWSRDTTQETDLGNQLEQQKKDPLPLRCESFSNVSLRFGALSGGQSVPGQRFFRTSVVSLPLASYLTGLMPFQYSCNQIINYFTDAHSI